MGSGVEWGWDRGLWGGVVGWELGVGVRLQWSVWFYYRGERGRGVCSAILFVVGSEGGGMGDRKDVRECAYCTSKISTTHGITEAF